ncbi:MAG TPA: MFS transporter [Candidatus Saccharimonadales bacterium]|nr:MFS transporter [Candidatus Saccharimonadales bacterium]
MQRTEFWKLSGLFFLHAMAMGAWFVPLGTVLDAHGLQSIKPFAFATSAVAAFVSPLIFGAMADRHFAPVVVLRWLALATGLSMALAATAIHLGLNRWAVLAVIQLHALCNAPTWGISSAIVLGRLRDSTRQFGPIRALGSLGWMAGCWLVSALHADTTALACFLGAGVWLCVAAFTYTLPAVAPLPSSGPLRIRDRLGLDALTLFKHRDHRVVFLTSALFSIPLAAFYPYTPTHLHDLGLERTSAWMSLGQVTEIIAMIGLAGVLGRWRFKWTLGIGIGFGLVRYGFCAMNSTPWVLAGVTLHGFAFALFFISTQIYLDQRIDPAWRSRAQSLYVVMTGGFGNLIGYLGTGWWFQAARRDGLEDWTLFWGVLSGLIALVLFWFLVAYRGLRAKAQGRI